MERLRILQMPKPFMDFLTPEEEFILAYDVDDWNRINIHTPTDFIDYQNGNLKPEFHSKQEILKGRTVESIVLKALDAYKNQNQE